MITVGLTGGIACGKSTVAGMLRERGVPVLDLDQVSREVVAPGEPALAEIGRRWPEVVGPEGLDRKALGAKLVGDPAVKREVEAILHPRIWERSAAWLQAREAEGAPVVAVEAALMVETGSYRRFDRLLVVSAAPEVQRRRLSEREGYDAGTVERWLSAQMPLAAKEAVADVVIRNDGGRGELERAVEEGWGALLGAGR